MSLGTASVSGVVDPRLVVAGSGSVTLGVTGRINAVCSLIWRLVAKTGYEVKITGEIQTHGKVHVRKKHHFMRELEDDIRSMFS